MILICLILAILAMITVPTIPWAATWGPYPNGLCMLLLIVLLFLMAIGVAPVTVRTLTLH